MRIMFEAGSIEEVAKQMIDFLANVHAEPTGHAQPARSAAAATEPPRPAGAPCTIDDVRERFARLIQAGHAEQAKEILADLGAQRLGELPEEKYAQAIERADALLG